MLSPASEAELAEMIKAATGPLCIRGGGTRGLAVTGEVLETSGMTGITLYEPGALTMVARAGTPLAEVEAALEAEGQMLAFEPPDLAGLTAAAGASTIGGVFATNASGPRRVRAGAARDFLLGVRFVDGSGNLVKNGGRVMKNVTGYDLVKLLAGSHGTLGIISEVSFKVLPKPETQASLMIYGPEGSDAVAIMSRALGSPFEVTGAYHTSRAESGYPITFLRLEGFEASVAYRLERLRDLVEPMVPGRQGLEISEMSEAERVALQWRSIRDLEDHHGTPFDLWKVSAKPSDAPILMARLPKDRRHNLDWGGGLIWVICEDGEDLRAELGVYAGHATLVHSLTPPAWPRFQPPLAPIARQSEGIRRQFDPHGILNTGLMG